ncbi:uncharacterized protein Z520_04720 [Fonsecaea multimorphosa CBS 102226]|uniref:Copper-fist domain-containing protein n=1 Tax=Fonsecaea multimorphosa CBS 102226 TaxID=1442371 RepID=A0A0D2K7J9_9EURO|nr:uncharacterized protein Z520_04720 [Fonsecaea multimorphosa CBS 102226]KIX99144.1 hypothetical protein Z520_04720 [Fonsecaea multimorphosa CBS 102226]OAL26056.1 hypothetical protein AYO22_04470 [Fonsecaea multimorphosa]
MQEPSATPPKVGSPAKGNSRVEDGKVKKIKASYKSETPAIQHINGKTYACESCKRGHRVHKCDHGKTRPISETNQPGRPSAGQKRGCHCPRNCACTTKACKCERDCACTQEMFLIVRVDNPAVISRDATSTPKPVWEDAEGNKMTLKKVWTDANGKEISDEEYQERKRRMKEREEAKSDEVNSSCCSSGKPNAEPESPKGGCRHRQNVAAIQPHPGLVNPESDHVQGLQPQSAGETWKSSCSCGSGCSCLYCPDHPNNATSINHAQQQVKNLAEQAYVGNQSLTPVPSISQNNPRSCMGGQPSFFLSSTADVSQHQLQQFFSETLNPNAIYLTYPIQQHSWTNRPLSSHCSHAQSPSSRIGRSPNDVYADPLTDTPTPWDLLPNESNGTWNFSDGQLGDNSFSWTDFEASYGTDYAIGQARVASMPNAHDLPIFQPQPAQQTPSMSANISSITSPPMLGGFPDTLSPFDSRDPFGSFDESATQNLSNQNIQANVFNSGALADFSTSSLPTFPVSQPPNLDLPEPTAQFSTQMGRIDGGLPTWSGNGYAFFQDSHTDPDLNGRPVSSSPPIASNAL